MKRHPQWRSRLEQLIDRVERDAFSFGTADCGPNWAGLAVEAVLGIDPAARYRGAYDSAVGALRIMRDGGYGDLAQMVGALLEEAIGVPCEIHPSAARLGDLMAIPDESPFGYLLGICNGERVLVRRADGKGSLDRGAATRAWRLGHA